MKKIRILLILALVVTNMIIFMQCLTARWQDAKTFAVTSLDFGEVGWGKNVLTLKAKNMSRGSRKLIITINTS